MVDQLEPRQDAEDRRTAGEGGKRRSHRWALLGLGAASGGLLFLSDYPVHAWWLQAVALLPWLWGLTTRRPGWGAGALSGAALGLVYTGGLSVVLAFPWLLATALALYLTVFWALLGAGAAWLLGAPERGPGGVAWGRVGAALGVACLAALVEWLNVSVIPVWGTAQVFTRVWSAWPPAIQIVSVTGVLGLVWVVVAVQALGAAVIAPAGSRRGPAVALAVVLGVVVAGNALLWPRREAGRIRVAAVGWTFGNLPNGVHTAWRWTWREVCLPRIAEAAGRGAKLVVTPETGVRIPKRDEAAFRGAVADAARRHGVFLAVGWFDYGQLKNRILFMDPAGADRGEYTKTHLIMTLEKYRPGDGTRVVTDLGGWRLGGMICQDDNFTDLSRGYGRSGVHLVAVPTNDWRQVMDYHLENSRFRAVDSRYAVVRAATNGHSAIVSARGELLARVDHFAKGPAVIVADVPLYPPGALYAKLGDWIVVPCALWLLFVVVVRIRRRRA